MAVGVLGQMQLDSLELFCERASGSPAELEERRCCSVLELSEREGTSHIAGQPLQWRYFPI